MNHDAASVTGMLFHWKAAVFQAERLLRFDVRCCQFLSGPSCTNCSSYAKRWLAWQATFFAVREGRRRRGGNGELILTNGISYQPFTVRASLR